MARRGVRPGPTLRMRGVAVSLRGQLGDGAADLGQAVHLDEVGVGKRLQCLGQQGRWHRGRAVNVGAQLAEERDRVGPEFENLAEHRGHQEGAGGAGEHRPGQRRTVDLAGHDAGDAGVDAELRVGGAADVEQRHRDHVLVVGLELEGPGVEGVRHQVGLSQPDALGVSGGARGVHDHAHVVRADVRTAAARGGCGEHGLVLVALGAFRSDLDDMLHTRNPVADHVDTVLEFGADDEQFGAGVVEDVVRLLPGEPEVDDRGRGPERRGRQGGLDACRMVLVQEGHHIAAADPAVGQCAGQSAYPVVELGPGEGAAQVGDGDLVGFGLRPVRQAVVEEARFGRLLHTGQGAIRGRRVGRFPPIGGRDRPPQRGPNGRPMWPAPHRTVV